MTLIDIAIILFLIMDPFGNISSFLNLINDIPPRRRRLVILREMSIALGVMIVFNFIGETLFDVLKISKASLQLTSAVILFLVAIKILFPSPDSLRANLPRGEPFITPLAVPLVAGPSLLATIMLFAKIEPSSLVMLGGILLAWGAASAVVLFSGTLQRLLTSNGLNACERLMGMILIMVAIQRFLEGIQEFVKLQQS